MPNYNIMYFPAAVLQSPNFDINQPDYINYGSMVVLWDMNLHMLLIIMVKIMILMEKNLIELVYNVIIIIYF